MVVKLNMKKEVRAIAHYRALLISKYITSAALFLSFLYLGYLRYAASPMYILIFLYAIPPILSVTMRNYERTHHYKFLTKITEEPIYLLSSLKNKYHYTKLGYFSNSISYIVMIVLTLLWQYSNKKSEFIKPEIVYLPIEIIVSSIVILFIGIIYYRIKLPLDLSNNRV